MHCFNTGKIWPISILSRNQSGDQGHVTLEATLTNPASVKPSRPIPLILVLKRSADCMEAIQVESFEVRLKMTTSINNSNELRRMNKHEPVIYSKSELRLLLPRGVNELVIKPFDFDAAGGICLPSGIIPSFRTCNISRTYGLIIRLAIKSESSKAANLQLTLDLNIYSGIMADASTPQLPAYEPPVTEADSS